MPGTKKIISLTISAALLASMATLTGCGTADRNARTNTTRYNVQNTRPLDGVNRDGVNRFGARTNGMNVAPLSTNTNVTGHPVRNLQVDRNLSKRISELPDVKSATVLVGDRHAYVAVALKDQANKTGVATPSGKGTTHGMTTHGVTTHGVTTDGVTTHGVNGTRGNYTTDGIAPGATYNGVTGYGTPVRRGDGLYGTMGTGSYGMIRGLTDGTRTDGTRTDGAHMYGTHTDGTTVQGAGTAYEPAGLTQAVKSRIANKVKQFAPSIQQVYVSANPDFVKHSTDFARSVQSGHPVKGLSAQLVDIIQRIFPAPAAGTNRPLLNTPPTRPQNHTPAPLNYR
ncbi:YhcN/YlaJ family sporulation lipoprotein [Paenibacillus farraposensis]|uniref:YhcN/YlaJ family sporulation lipoprotein n=1 Tax=Paenibacillus farraposensis TaxID=2807095 RepID=A0ABW4DFM2_9BACL|nr:YhcN/YlaJ family sporulation lipoprotein [Paenibacillus farraposensis]MCC3378670.1 YhcN/YlaJ family sporulation lipoprotein [Paenibacillus farraposensis]